MSDLVTERYIAIDNVCAWPNLTQLPDGTIITTIFNQPCHGHWQGDVECWASTDGGRLWEYRGTPAPHESRTVRMNVAAGLANNGDLVVIASGWGTDTMTHAEYKEASAQPGFKLDRGDIIHAWVCRSSDGGRTWSIDKDAFPEPGDRQYVPFGDICTGSNGRLHVSAYHSVKDADGQPQRSAYFFTSDDDGRSWSEPATIKADDQNETTPLRLGDGRWIVASRTADDASLNQFRSDDDGQTWRFDQALALPRQHPAHLLRLKDDRIVLTYGVRNRGAMGIYFRVSNDQAQTWSAPIALVTYPDADHGYPSTVQNADGSLTTAWYCARIPQHNRYHMGTAIWHLPE